MSTTKKILGPVLGITLLAIAVWVLVHKLRDFTIAELLRGIAHVHISSILIAIALTAVYYGVATLYDTLAFHYIQRPVPYRRVALAAFVAYAFSHNVGMTLLSSGSMRYRIHSSFGLKASETAKVVVFCSVTVWIGLMTTAGLLYSLAPVQVPDLLHLPVESLRPIGIGALSLLLIYGVIATHAKHGFRIWKMNIPHISRSIFLMQIIVGVLDWTVGALVVFVLLPRGAHMPFHFFLEYYLLAQLSGLASQVPGGIGVFESVLLYLMPEKVPVAATLASLLLYRAIFYILPLIISTMLLATHEVTINRKAIETPTVL